MKKLSFCRAAVLSCALLFSGCASSAGTPGENRANKLNNIPFEDGQYYAAAYLGYQQITGLEVYAEQYLEHDRIPIHYLSSGDYYLVIPRYAGMSLSLFRNDIETGETILIYEDPDCRPFILQCNASDIFADATVRLSYGGETAEFSPFISLKDGEIEIGAKGLDITEGLTDSGQNG